jgi:uncharacterized protein YutE (UPF0331/DUF86 family)
MREEIIRTKLKQMEESIKSVKENLPSSLEKFINLGLVKDGIYKRVEFAIENVLDICNIINADLELGLPSEEGEIIDNLVKTKILSKKMGRKIKSMRGFRNFLVHRYGLIDDRIAFKNIKRGLKDFFSFKKEILKFLEK